MDLAKVLLLKFLDTQYLMQTKKFLNYTRITKKFTQNLKKELPKHISSFPIKKKEISDAILSNKSNLKKIVKIVHTEIRKK